MRILNHLRLGNKTPCGGSKCRCLKHLQSWWQYRFLSSVSSHFSSQIHVVWAADYCPVYCDVFLPTGLISSSKNIEEMTPHLRPLPPLTSAQILLSSHGKCNLYSTSLFFTTVQHTDKSSFWALSLKAVIKDVSNPPLWMPMEAPPSSGEQTFSVYEHSVPLKLPLMPPRSHHTLLVLPLPHCSSQHWTLQVCLLSFLGLSSSHQPRSDLLWVMAFHVARTWSTFHSSALASPLSLRIPRECLPGFSDHLHRSSQPLDALPQWVTTYPELKHLGASFNS